MSLQLTPAPSPPEPPPAERPSADLDSLAAEIRHEHENVVAGVRTTVEAAIRCGRLLLRAKSLADHGNWSTWLAEHFPASPSTARGYMRLATHYANRQLPADLTIDAALKQIAAPKEDRLRTTPIEPPTEEAIEAQARVVAAKVNPDPESLEYGIAFHNHCVDGALKREVHHARRLVKLAEDLEDRAPQYAAAARRVGHLTLAAPEPWELAEAKAEAREQFKQFANAAGELLDAKLRHWVEVEGKMLKEIAELIGCDEQKLADRCDRLGIGEAK